MARRAWLGVVLGVVAAFISGCGYGEESGGSGSGRDVGRSTPPPTPPPPQTRPAPPPPGPGNVPDLVYYQPPDPGIISGYIGGALGALRMTQVLADLAPINDWLKTYQAENGRFPKDMQELVTLYKADGGRFARPPGGYKHFYWPSHGVVKMVPLSDQRFRDPQRLYSLPEESIE